jgi:DNA-binding GntR family transcriptional regulator
MQTTNLQNIYDEVIQAFELEEVTEEMQEAFLMQFGDMIYEAVTLRAVEELPEDAYDDFDALIATNPDIEDVFAFFESNIPTFNDLVIEETQNIKSDLDKKFAEYEEGVEK